MKNPIRIGADVGGTFTDIILMNDVGNIWRHKVPSTPPNFEQAVLRAVEQLVKTAGFSGADVTEVAHGTTVATNAVLEHRGARTALVTTQGFRDVLELRRIRAPQMYDLFWTKPEPLVERYLRFEISERVAADGTVLSPIPEAALWELKKKLEREKVEAVAVCFLHSYAYPHHELVVGNFLQAHLPHLQVSLSHQVLPERKEYERTATTVVNAYVAPLMGRYLNAMRGGLGAQEIEAPLLIMQSAGGLTPEEDAARRPVYVLESGPAAGVLAAAFTARNLGLENIITLDVGGTTAKTSLIERGEISYSSEYEVGASLSAGNRLVGGGGDRIRAASIDIAEVGSGGGSIAYLDRAGGLRVGPQSAGALPGPACYQRGGTEPTVTDANVVLGYIRPGNLADGEVSIDLDVALRAIHDRIAAPLGMDTYQAAEGIHRIANAVTMRALRSVSTERGRDPRDFALMAFGGSGPIHAAGLARDLYVPQTIVPPLPGLFSALGLLYSGIEHHAVRSCALSGNALTASALWQLRDEMRGKMIAQFESEGFAPAQVTLRCNVDLRFLGQASEIRLTLDERDGTYMRPYDDAQICAMIKSFQTEHQRLYGHGSDPETPIQVVAVRLVGKAGTADTMLNADSIHAQVVSTNRKSRRVFFGGKWGILETSVVTRNEVRAATRGDSPTQGPLLIDEYDSTTVVPPDMRVSCDAHGNLVLQSV